MNIRHGVEENPYVVSLYEPHPILRHDPTAIHCENIYSLPSATGVSQIIINKINKLDDGDLKDLTEHLDKYKKAYESVARTEKELEKLKTKAKGTLKKSADEQVKTADKNYEKAKETKKSAEDEIKKYLNKIKEKIDLFADEKKIEFWQDWYDLYRYIKPEDFQDDPKVQIPPPKTVSADDARRTATGGAQRRVAKESQKGTADKALHNKVSESQHGAAGDAPRRAADESVNGAAGGNEYVVKHKNIPTSHGTNAGDSKSYVVDRDKIPDSKEIEDSGNSSHVEIMNHKDVGHEPRHHTFKHMTTGVEQKLWHALFHFSKQVASESKYIVYRTLTEHLRLGNPEDFLIFGCSPVALAENEGKPFTIQETIHQIVRSFLHMHDNQLQAIIWIYLRFHYGLVTEQEAFSVLVFAVQTELQHNFEKNEPWDIGFLYNLLKKFDNKRSTIFIALHNGLKHLNDRVVFIEWIGDWKNFMKLHRCEHGPLKQIIEGYEEIEVKCPELKIFAKAFTCPYSKKEYPSFYLLKKHLRLKILGTEELPKFQIFKEHNGEIISEPFEIESLNVDEIHKGLLYKDNTKDESKNLFFITNDKHFKNCNLLQIEENNRQHIRNSFFYLGDDTKIYAGNLISVGIDKVICQRFVKSQKDIIISSMNPIKVWKQNLETINKSILENKKNLVQCKKDIQVYQKKIVELTNSLSKKTLEESSIKNLENRKIYATQQVEKLKELEIDYNKSEESLPTKKLEYIDTILRYNEFNFYYSNRTSEMSNQEKEKRIMDLIGYFSEVEKINKRLDGEQRSEDSEVDTYRLTLLTFAIFSSSKIRKILDDVLNKIQEQVKEKMTTGKKIFIKNQYTEDNQKLEQIITNINSYFINHGLIKYKLRQSENIAQVFMSPFHSLLIQNWLSDSKNDVGIHINLKTKPGRKVLEIIEKNKIELEWQAMQKYYNETGNSSTYKWYCDLSEEQLQVKVDEQLREILKWKIFVLMANMCCMYNISKLTNIIFNDNQREDLIKMILHRNMLLKNITKNLEQHVFNYPIDRNDLIQLNSDNIQESSLSVSGIDDFEKQTVGSLIERDLTLYFSSAVFKDLSMSEIQAKMFQSAKLLLPRLKEDKIDFDIFKTIKWFEKIEERKSQQKALQDESQQKDLQEESQQVLSTEVSQPTTLPYLIMLPTGPSIELRVRDHLKKFEGNREFLIDQEQRKYTYEDDLFQVHFLSIDHYTVGNRLIALVSYFTNFSVEELKSKLIDIMNNIRNLKIDSKIVNVITDYDIAQDFNNYLNYKDFDTDTEYLHERVTIVLLVHVTKRPIHLYVTDLKEGKLKKDECHNEDVINHKILFAEPICILKHTNDFLEYLVVDGYSRIKSEKTYDLEEKLYDTVKKWNQSFEHSQDYNMNFEMSLCKHYLFLIYKKSKYTINEEMLLKLHKTLTGKNLRKFLSMEKDLHLVCRTYPITTEEYEALLLRSKYDLLEECIHQYLEIQKIKPKMKKKLNESSKVNEDEEIIDKLNETYDEETNVQSGCRAVKLVKKSDGGYDTGELKNYGVEDGTDDENDWDDGYDNGDYDSEDDDDENDQEKNDKKEKRKFLQNVEKDQKKEYQGGKQSHMVTFTNARGKQVTRRENANERSRRLNNEGKAIDVREAANKRASAAQARRRHAQNQDLNDAGYDQ